MQEKQPFVFEGNLDPFRLLPRCWYARPRISGLSAPENQVRPCRVVGPKIGFELFQQGLAGVVPRG